MSDRAPVIAIGMDAAEVEVVEELLAQGRMPHLATLRATGCWGRIESQPPDFLSMVWPSFYSSQPLGEHGWYFNKLWRPERQRVEYVNPSWLPNRIFWEGLQPCRRVALLDLPFAARVPEGLNGLYLNGWQSHDDFGAQEFPPGYRATLESYNGKSRLAPELFGQQTASTLVSQRSEVVEANRQFGSICADVVRQEPWDLFLAVFGAVHRGTHYLWDLSQITLDGVDADTLKTLRGARDDCYTSWDSALGDILEVAPRSARLMVFALHGMEANHGWHDRLQAMVERIHTGGHASPAPKKGANYRLKTALPWKVIRQVTRRIPHAWNKAMVPLWSRRMHDWSKTRYFTLPMDVNGYIRLNVVGREREGIVHPSEVEAVCNEIQDGLLGFRDIESGEPVVKAVRRVDEAIGAATPARRVLPDLVVLWRARRSSQESCGVVSDRYGEVRWPRGAAFLSGRSGNHTSHGWFVATGPGIGPGTCENVHDTIDLMPTLFEWMGEPLPDFFRGHPIPALTGGLAPADR